MDFVDEVTIQVSSGKGGDGVVAFRREKFVPRGGPNGGDGGYGGDVVLEADQGLNTLVEFRYKSHYKAENGENGGANNKNGSSRPPLVIKVPVGTSAVDIQSGRMIADLTYHGQTFVIARGGRGGRGNAAFASSTEQAPKYCEYGEPGESLSIRLELRLLADAGVIGFPSSGKSTLIASVSNARPKIADYPFTTLIPNLGVVRVSPTESFVMADLPGLIEGASQGAGLGHQFLRHIERTRVLVHVIDCSPFTMRDPVQDYHIIRNELISYNPRLGDLPEIIALNKTDIPEAKKRADEAQLELKKLLSEDGSLKMIRQTSTASGDGVQQLVWDVGKVLREIPKAPSAADDDVVRIEGPEVPWTVTRLATGEFVVKGREPERMVAMTDLSTEKTLRRLHSRLDAMGILKELAKSGAKDGDTVKIGEFEFDWIEEDKDDEEEDLV